MLQVLSRLPFLVASLIATVGLTCAFIVVQTHYVGGPLLDSLSAPEAVRARLESMTRAQREYHLLATLTLDSAFPLAYGSVIAGLAARLSGSRGILIALPALATMAADYAENIVQVLALVERYDWLAAKTLLTPLKFGMLLISATVIVWLAARALWKRFSKGRMEVRHVPEHQDAVQFRAAGER
jgi:hypothetical protein